MAMDCIDSSGRCFDAVTDQTGPSGGFSQSGEWRFGPGNMKKALVALARRFDVIMHRMWVDGEPFRWGEETAAA